MLLDNTGSKNYYVFLCKLFLLSSVTVFVPVVFLSSGFLNNLNCLELLDILILLPNNTGTLKVLQYRLLLLSILHFSTTLFTYLLHYQLLLMQLMILNICSLLPISSYISVLPHSLISFFLKSILQQLHMLVRVSQWGILSICVYHFAYL